MSWLDEAPEVGQHAPHWTLSNQYGERLSESVGGSRSVLLFFFPYAFTSVCTREIRALNERADDFAAVGCRVFGISTDTMFCLRAFADAEALRFDLLSDHWPHGAVAERFGAFDDQRGCARRASFLISDRVISWRDGGELPESRDLDAHLAAARAPVA